MGSSRLSASAHAARRAPLVALLLAVFATVTCGPFAGVVAQATASSLPSTSDYDNTAILDANFELYWTVKSDSETIHFAARAKTAGWLAIGLSETGGMIGSDAMVGWVADGTVFATDRFIFNKSYDTTGLSLDAQQDWRLLGGQEVTNQSSGDTWTTIHFWRALDTGDCNDRPIRPEGIETFLLWAMGETDEVSYHALTRGVSVLTLVAAPSIEQPGAPGGTPSSSSAVVSKLAPGRGTGGGNGGAGGGAGGAVAAPGAGKSTWQYNFTFDELHVSTNYTTYMCRFFDWKHVDTKQHVVEFGPIINGSNPAVLHHALIYGCDPEMDPTSLPPTDTAFDCLKGLPCSRPLGLWAIGGKPFKFPKQAGYPVGPGFYTRFVLQTHYTNPDHLPGIVDSSGLYFKVGPPREFDAGVMETGPVVYDLQIKIPPQMPSWTQRTICSPGCTRRSFESPIHIMSSALHEHAIGRQMYIDIYRDNEKIFNLSRVDYYDFASQQAIRLNPSFEMMPGDEIRTTCVWDSTSRQNDTLGGQASNDEMCIGYILYYPARVDKKRMDACFDFCAGFDADKNLILDPNSPLLSTYYYCAGEIIPGLKKCNISYGENLPLKVVHGCPAESYALVTDIPSNVISFPEGTANVSASDTTATIGTPTTTSTGKGGFTTKSTLKELCVLLLVAIAMFFA